MITIIIPIYNSQQIVQNVKKCINSTLIQTYRDLEVILIVDEQLSNAYDLCSKYAKEDCRITLIDDYDLDLASARNLGLNNMHGDYVMFVNSDDYLMPYACEYLRSALAKSHADISIGQFTYIYQKYAKPADIYNKSGVYSQENMLNQYFNHNSYNLNVVWGKLYKTSIFEDLLFDSAVHTDVDILYKLYYAAERTRIIDDIVYCYCPQNYDNLTSAQQSIEDYLQVLMNAVEWGEDKSAYMQAFLKQRCIKYYYELAGQQQKYSTLVGHKLYEDYKQQLKDFLSTMNIYL